MDTLEKFPASRPAPIQSRALETRERIIEAGRTALAKKPYAALRTKRDVLDPAGISVGAFYHQFADKGELIAAMLEARLAGYRQELDQAIEFAEQMSPADMIRRTNSLILDHVDSDPATTALLHQLDPSLEPRIKGYAGLRTRRAT